MVQSRATMRGVPGDAARRRGLRRILVPLICFGVAFGLGIGLILGSAGFMPWWGGIVVLLLVGIGFAHYAQKQPTLVYGYFKGARGEEMAAGELSHLPAEWTVFNGVVLPCGKDVDHIAVGPQGVFVVETKHWRGDVAIENGQVIANGRVIQKSPILQVRHAISAVAETLDQPLPSVNGILCFAGHQFSDGAVCADEVLVCSHLSLLSTLTSGPARLDAAAISRCVARLGSLTITEGL